MFLNEVELKKVVLTWNKYIDNKKKQQEIVIIYVIISTY